MRSIPIRVRVAAAFAVVLAAVLAATGWFVHSRVSSDFSANLDQALRLRVHDLTPLVESSRVSLAASSGTPFVKEGESYAQLLDANGHVVDATAPLDGTPLLDDAELEAALRTPLLLDRDPPPLPRRVVAHPRRTGHPARRPARPPGRCLG